MRRQPATLSESLSRRLNSYALAASAAGVSVLALTQSAEAKIVYHPVRHKFRLQNSYPLDLNHDRMTDFTVYFSQFTYGGQIRLLKAIGAQGSNQIAAGIPSTILPAYAYALKKNSLIPGSKKSFWQIAHIESARSIGKGSGVCGGYWQSVRNGYLGLAFLIKGKTHYGWARMSVHCRTKPSSVSAVLTGYAYETIPNRPIIAGKTHGKDVVTVQPASLGHLARGASAIPAWRGNGQ